MWIDQEGSLYQGDCRPGDRAATQEEIDAKAPKWSRNPTLNRARDMREVCLNRLIGIGFTAAQTGDQATVNAVISARAALLQVTDTQAVLEAENEAALVAAITAGYAAIVAACPANLRSAFRDARL